MDFNHDIPRVVQTPRLVLRAWTPADAEVLGPVLAENGPHLKGWIPAHVSDWAPIEQLRERLGGYATDFAAGRALRYAVFTIGDAAHLLGGADLHPRLPSGRVPLAEADGVELGYWLAKSAEGFGYAVEAARALLEVARTVPLFTYAEARVVPTNVRSAAVARRLGFSYARCERGLDVWQLSLARPAR